MPTRQFKLGLKPPVPGAVKLRLATYLDFNKLPPVPAGDFGHGDLISDWGMLANDQYGDCAIAGACHQTMLWTTEGAGTAAPFDDQIALANYSAITGFNPDDPNSDQGTEVSQLADYWSGTGIIDTAGNRHKIAAVMDLNPGDLRELWVATYLFQAVGLGFALPDSAMDQTERGEPWDVVRGAHIEGGHYVPCVGRKGGNGVAITWGQTQQFTTRFYRKYNNQGIVALSEEMLKLGKSIDGFDDALLRQDLEAF